MMSDLDLPVLGCGTPSTASGLSSHLALLQLSDSAFPNGRYTLSYGLEAFAQSVMLTSSSPLSTLGRLLSDCLRFGVAPSDGIALACAHRAMSPDNVVDLALAARADQRLSAVKLARESREASVRTGRALLSTAITTLGTTALSDFADLVYAGRSPANHAVVFGLVSAALGVPRLDAVAAELYGFSAGWTAAAVRLGLIDHRAAQSLLHRVRPVTVDAVFNAADGDVTHISSCTPLVDVMAMRHEHAELRLFAS
jgi:urease accessory protein